MEKTFILNEPLDMHLHLRDGDMLRLVALLHQIVLVVLWLCQI